MRQALDRPLVDLEPTRMMVLLEGPDGAGKTTLAAKLAARLKVRASHHGPYPGKTGPWLFTTYGDDLLAANGVVDRAHPSETIYARVLGRHDRLGSHARLLDRLLWSNQGIIVKCLPPDETCRAATRGRPEYVPSKFRPEVYDEYAKWEPRAPWVPYDWTTDDVDELWATLLKNCASFNLGPGVGHWRKGVTLVVGEQVTAPDSHGATNPWDLPFVGWSGCSGWLAKQLDAHGVREADTYWVNALNPGGSRLDPGFLDELKPRRVIAVGHLAQGWCLEHGVQAMMVSHPQWERRFKHSRPSQLAKELIS